MTRSQEHPCLVVRVGAQLCALPLQHVAETFRPQPARPVAGAPPFVSGVALIRGQAVPVVAAGDLLGVPSSPPTRFVSLRVDDRLVALAVDRVVGVRSLPDLARLPPLLTGAAREAVSAVATLDSELLVVLDAARLVPPDVWASPGIGGAS
ncbi:MAG TPA: chemotaxis protein CheW [Vicinamibacterales bacterium]